jgi:hypothetical protein
VNRQSIPQTLSEVRAELVKRIGREQLDELHRQDLRIDLVAAVILLGLFAGGFVLVHHYPVWWVGIPVALIGASAASEAA